MLCLGIFGLELKKKLSYLKSTLSNLCNCKILQQRKKKQNLGIFALEFLKNYCNIWNQRYQICLIGNFSRKQKCLNLGPKMLYLGFFLARIL